jgi:hypothetical protein
LEKISVSFIPHCTIKQAAALLGKKVEKKCEK